MAKSIDKSGTLSEGGVAGIGTSADCQKPLLNALRMDLGSLYKEAEDVYSKLNTLDGVEKPSMECFVNAYVGYKGLMDKAKNQDYLTLVDFFPGNGTGGLFYIVHLKSNTVEYSNQVAHGKGSSDYPNEGWEKESPDSYSNTENSKQSSLGFFLTADKIRPSSMHIWEGLKLTGLEKGVNDKADERNIYIHPAGLNQSEGCFILPYDKAEGQAGEDEILKQLYKLRGGSVVFAYDSRVFEKYKKQSMFFSEKVNLSDEPGSYVVDDSKKEEVEARIKANTRKEPAEFVRKVVSVPFRVVFKDKYEKEFEKDRECWRKKKEIEMLATQLFREKETRIPEDLREDIKRAFLEFSDTFYDSTPRVRRSKIDSWIYGSSEKSHEIENEDSLEDVGFREIVRRYVLGYSDDEVADRVMDIVNEKYNEYKRWEENSSQKHRKIPEKDQAERRLAA